VHFVDEKMDHGPIIAQAVVPVFNDDTPQSLADRILKKEHKVYPMALQFIAEGRLKIEGRRVIILGKEGWVND
jgi:phosphoribosylglycinamide formyltransferase-1